MSNYDVYTNTSAQNVFQISVPRCCWIIFTLFILLFTRPLPSKTVAYFLRVLVSLPQICPHLSTSFHKFDSLPSTVSSVPTLQTRLHVCLLVYFSLTRPALLCPLTDSFLTTCRLPGEDSPLGNDAAQKTVTLQSAAAPVQAWRTGLPAWRHAAASSSSLSGLQTKKRL